MGGGRHGYSNTILRADAKDLVFPGNFQEIMNKVAAERLAALHLQSHDTR